MSCLTGFLPILDLTQGLPAQALDAAQADLDALAGGCTRISGALTSSRASAAEMLAETERVARDLAASETRSRLVDAFLQQYQLSPDEVAALQVRACDHCPRVGVHDMISMR